MWSIGAYTEGITHPMSHPGISVGAIALTAAVMVACLSALVVIWRLREARPGLGLISLAPAAPPGVRRLRSARFLAHLPPHSSRMFLNRGQRIRSGANVADISDKRFDSARLPRFSAFSLEPGPARGRSVGVAIYEEPKGAPSAWDGGDAPERDIPPPIWRHVASLIEAYRTEPLRPAGEASEAGALAEPAPPIWREASALRIELAEMERALEAAGQGLAPGYAPALPIWRSPEAWGPAGLQFESSDAGIALDSSLMDAAPHDLSELAIAPPIWNSPVLDAGPERRVWRASEELEAAITTEPPIWAPHMRQR